MLHRHKIIGRVVFSGRGSPTVHLVCRQRHQLHPILNGPDVGQIFLPGEHDAGNGPDHIGRHIDPLHPFRQFALPVRAGDRVKARCFQHCNGICPRIQHLYIEKSVRLRYTVKHRFCADIEKCLRIDGIHIRRDDCARCGVCQLFRMDELVDRRTGIVRCFCVG